MTLTKDEVAHCDADLRCRMANPTTGRISGPSGMAPLAEAPLDGQKRSWEACVAQMGVGLPESDAGFPLAVQLVFFYRQNRTALTSL